MGPDGWSATHDFAKNFINRFASSGSDVMLSVILFSGPKTWSQFRECVGTGTINMTSVSQKDICGLNMVQHFTDDMPTALNAVEPLTHPNGTTLTSAALRMAQAELALSRPDSTAVVLVVSDGLPLSPRMTEAAATDIKKIARLMFVPVDLPHEDIQAMRTWSSVPA